MHTLDFGVRVFFASTLPFYSKLYQDLEIFQLLESFCKITAKTTQAPLPSLTLSFKYLILNPSFLPLLQIFFN